jgi:hypothetical protein
MIEPSKSAEYISARLGRNEYLKKRIEDPRGNRLLQALISQALPIPNFFG